MIAQTQTRIARIGSTVGYTVSIDTAKTTQATIYAAVTSPAGSRYEVILPAAVHLDGVCSCPDNRERAEQRTCKHQKAVREHMAAAKQTAKPTLQLVPKAVRTFRPIVVSGSSSGAKYSAFVLAYDSSRSAEPGAGYYSAGNFEGPDAARDAARLADKLTAEAAKP